MDAAYSGDSGVGVASVVDLSNGRVVETAWHKRDSLPSYLPGFFGFREAPLIYAAAVKLELVPDAFIVEGHGLAHPRRFGLACQIGVALDRPTIGVARRLLCGTVKDERILDDDGAVLGRILRVGTKQRRLFVSVGNKIDIETAVETVKRTLAGSDYPLPLRTAHEVSLDLRRKLLRP